MRDQNMSRYSDLVDIDRNAARLFPLSDPQHRAALQARARKQIDRAHTDARDLRQHAPRAGKKLSKVWDDVADAFVAAARSMGLLD